MISTIEVNKACDLCNCLWGTDGNQACDPALTAKYAIPVIPPRCPRRYPATRGYRNGAPAYTNTATRKVMERIAGVERERRVIAELAKHPKLTRRAMKQMGAGNRGWAGPISLKGVGKCRS